MPRTVEHIVACHEAAAARRAAGIPIWDRKLNFKGLLSTDETPEHIAVVSVAIARRIRAQLPASFFDITHDDYDYDFVDAIEMMGECTVAALAEDKANGVDAVDMFNGWLETIYDWADNNRVWID